MTPNGGGERGRQKLSFKPERPEPPVGQPRAEGPRPPHAPPPLSLCSAAAASMAAGPDRSRSRGRSRRSLPSFESQRAASPAPGPAPAEPRLSRRRGCLRAERPAAPRIFPSAPPERQERGLRPWRRALSDGCGLGVLVSGSGTVPFPQH